MNNKKSNEDVLKQKTGEILENILKTKEELYNSCKDFFDNYLTYSLTYLENLKNLIIKYDKIKIIGQYEEIIFSFMIELSNIQCDIFREFILSLKSSIKYEISVCKRIKM